MEDSNAYKEDDNNIVREFNLTPESLLSNVEVDGKESTTRSLDVATFSSSISPSSQPNYRSIAIEGPIENQASSFLPSMMMPQEQYGSILRPKEFVFHVESPSIERSKVASESRLDELNQAILSTVEVSSPSTTAISQVDELPPPPSYRPLHKLSFSFPLNSFNSNTLDFLQAVHHTLFDLGLDSNFVPTCCLWEVCVLREGKHVEWKMRCYLSKKDQQKFVLEQQRVSGSNFALNKFHHQIKKRLQMVAGIVEEEEDDDEPLVEEMSGDDEEEVLLESLNDDVVLSIPTLTHHSSSSSSHCFSLSPPPLDLNSLSSGSGSSLNEQDETPLPQLTPNQVKDSLTMFSEMISTHQDQHHMAASSLSSLLSSASDIELGHYVREGVAPLLVLILTSSACQLAKQFAVISIARLSEVIPLHFFFSLCPSIHHTLYF